MIIQFRSFGNTVQCFSGHISEIHSRPLKINCHAKAVVFCPATVHKILVHGSDVVDFAVVPIGQLSEEVLECRHKEVRRFRLQNTRKISRTKTNEDLLHALLISSDPVVT